MPEVVITMSHVREAGFCAPGLRDFCQRNNIDMRRLAREGIPLSEVENISDANLQRVIERAKGEE